MQCNKVITGVNFRVGDKALKASFLIIEPSGFEHSLVEVVAGQLEGYMPVDFALGNLLAWSRGESGPFALLISLDSKYATLRKVDAKGEVLLSIGEEIHEFFGGPIQGGPSKFFQVLDREIGVYPSECKKFGYSNKLNRKSLPRRTDLRGYGEFDPYFMAKLGLDPKSAPTGSLVWTSILGDSAIMRLGGSPQEIKAELQTRLRISPDGTHQDRDHIFYDTNKLTMSEVSSRRDRAERYWHALTYTASQLEGVEAEAQLEAKVVDAIVDIDLAVELHIVSRCDDERSEFGRQGTLSRLLWNRIGQIEATENPYLKEDFVN